MLRLTIGMETELILLENNYRVFTFTYPKTYLLIPWSRVLLAKLTGIQLVKKFHTLYGTQGSLPHSQVPASSSQSTPAHPTS
jgi:hypothetical protein